MSIKDGKSVAFAALGFCLALSACADRLDHLGKPPSMSAPGTTSDVPPLSKTYVPVPPPAEPLVPSGPNSLWKAGSTSFFGDQRAKKIGDILTVMIVIDDKAEIDNKTTRSRSGSESMGIDNMFGVEGIVKKVLPSDADLSSAIGLNSESGGSGNGAVRRKEEIELKVAATIMDRMPNGNFIIRGSQEVRVNYELRDLQIAGIIRPEDINRNNTISYEKIAEARISYGGRGQITDLQQPRYGQQVIDMIAPF